MEDDKMGLSKIEEEIRSSAISWLLVRVLAQFSSLSLRPLDNVGESEYVPLILYYVLHVRYMH